LSPLRLPFRHSGARVRYTARRLRGHPAPVRHPSLRSG
jgi:hypothetical protein